MFGLGGSPLQEKKKVESSFDFIMDLKKSSVKSFCDSTIQSDACDFYCSIT